LQRDLRYARNECPVIRNPRSVLSYGDLPLKAHAPSVFPGAYFYIKVDMAYLQRRICAVFIKENVNPIFSLFNACPVA
jgi:hypothetical protein